MQDASFVCFFPFFEIDQPDKNVQTDQYRKRNGNDLQPEINCRLTGMLEQLDAVGTCVGVNGSRVNAIVKELGGEKIDIVNEKIIYLTR